nr:hypothetical protein [uncultured Niameybacter sp.]
MKLAEAVLRRNQHRENVRELHMKLESQLLIPEEEVLEEDSKVLLDRLEEEMNRYHEMNQCIERAYNNYYVEEGLTLKDLILERNYWKMRWQKLDSIVAQLTGRTCAIRDLRYRKEGQSLKKTLQITMVENQREACKEMYNALDVRIQEKSWEIIV